MNDKFTDDFWKKNLFFYYERFVRTLFKKTLVFTKLTMFSKKILFITNEFCKKNDFSERTILLKDCLVKKNFPFAFEGKDPIKQFRKYEGGNPWLHEPPLYRHEPPSFALQ